MNYELALKLRDAGFPQNISEGDKICTGLLSNPRLGLPPQYPITTVLNVDAYTMSGKRGWVKYPTLSELIEACGEGFAHLEVDRYMGAYSKAVYLAYGWDIPCSIHGGDVECRDFWSNPNTSVPIDVTTTGTTGKLNCIGKGSTPEEAVASLWLALNEKK